MTHPFITAMQEALDTHGLPPGIAVISVGAHWRGKEPTFTAWASQPGDRMASSTGNSDCLAWACELALEKQGVAEANEAAREMARAALVSAGHDPDLIK